MNRVSQSTNNVAAMAWLSAMALVVGIIASLAWITTNARNSQLTGLPTELQRNITLDDIAAAKELETARNELNKIREENTRLQNLVANNTNASEELNSSLQETKAFAGLTEVEGEGVTITLKDSQRPLDEVLDPNENIVHDQDVLSVINELWNSGAQAISVNDKRIGPGSWVRCAGTRILVDSVQVAAPVVVRAIGEPEELYSSMNMPGGYLDQLRQTDPAMVRMDVSTKLNIPAFTGTTKRDLLKEPEKTD